MILKDLQKLEKLVNSELASKVQRSIIENNEFLIEISETDLIDVIQFLKSNDSCKFRQLIDIAGVDYPENEKRFQLVYLFLSHEKNLRIKLLIKFDLNQIIPSITKIFPSANWMEREVFDMYGVKFKNHPDLRRIFGMFFIVIPLVINIPESKQNPAVTPAASVGEKIPP